MADKAQGYDYVGYHNYAKRRYSELVGGEWRLTFSVSIVMLCNVMLYFDNILRCFYGFLFLFLLCFVSNFFVRIFLFLDL